MTMIEEKSNFEVFQQARKVLKKYELQLMGGYQFRLCVVPLRLSRRVVKAERSDGGQFKQN